MINRLYALQRAPFFRLLRSDRENLIIVMTLQTHYEPGCDDLITISVGQFRGMLSNNSLKHPILWPWTPWSFKEAGYVPDLMSDACCFGVELTQWATVPNARRSAIRRFSTIGANSAMPPEKI